MVTTVVMEILLLSPWNMTPSPTSLSITWLDMCLFCHYLLAPPPLSYHYVKWYAFLLTLLSAWIRFSRVPSLGSR
jgi:hypothetical protein